MSSTPVFEYRDAVLDALLTAGSDDTEKTRMSPVSAIIWGRREDVMTASAVAWTG